MAKIGGRTFGPPDSFAELTGWHLLTSSCRLSTHLNLSQRVSTCINLYELVGTTIINWYQLISAMNQSLGIVHTLSTLCCLFSNLRSTGPINWSGSHHSWPPWASEAPGRANGVNGALTTWNHRDVFLCHRKLLMDNEMFYLSTITPSYKGSLCALKTYWLHQPHANITGIEHWAQINLRWWRSIKQARTKSVDCQFEGFC